MPPAPRHRANSRPPILPRQRGRSGRLRDQRGGGLVVAPSGTCFERFLEDAAYRRAIVSADLALPDSGAMVALWTLLTGRALNRISGYAYIQKLLATIDLREVFWILPHARAQDRLLAWSRDLAGADSQIPPSAIRLPHFPPPHSQFRNPRSALRIFPSLPPPAISRPSTTSKSPMRRSLPGCANDNRVTS